MFNVISLASGYGQSEVIHDINLKVDKQEIVAVMGRNGMGKTTLFKTLMGILPMRHGSITVDGLDAVVDYKQARRRIGLVPQELSTDAFESVLATVTFSRRLFGRSGHSAYI